MCKFIVALVCVVLGHGMVYADPIPVVGETVIYRYDSSHLYTATVTEVVSGSEVVLVVFSNGSTWYNSVSYLVPAQILNDVYWAVNSDNRWDVNPNVPVTGPQGPQGDPGPTGATGPGALVTSVSTTSLTLGGSAVQFDSAHDVQYTATIKISATLTIAGGAAGHVDLVCDSGSSPTTVVTTIGLENTGTLTIGLTLVSSNTLLLGWRVPIGHFCKLVSTNDTGTPTYTIVRQFKQVLGN